VSEPDERVEAFWQEFCAATGTDPATRHDVYAFGDSPELAGQLLELVLTGPKRATAGLVVEYEHAGDPLPVVGTLSVVLDGSGAPRCVLRTTDVRVAPLNTVDAAFAHDEGEGDRTLAWWRAARDGSTARAPPAIGIEVDRVDLWDLDCVFERFELAWTPTPPTPSA
jgi:uncharacterized protein YhfF